MVLTGLWVAALAIDTLLIPVATGTSPTTIRLVVDVAGIVVSVAMCLYVKLVRHTPQIKADVGLGFLVLSAAGIAVTNMSVAATPNDSIRVSWIAVGILIFAMFAPASPVKMLVASLIAATMDPLAIWFNHLQGNPVPSLGAAFILFLPNYVCAGVAGVSSRALESLGRRLNEAREMGSYRLVERLGHGGVRCGVPSTHSSLEARPSRS